MFPVLQGEQMMGRLDARRNGAGLEVRAFWPEPGVRMGRAPRAGLEAEIGRAGGLAGTQ